MAGCTDDRPEAVTDETPPDLPSITVAVPPERTSTFCTAMVELTDDVRSGELDDVEQAIIDTYRSVAGDVPPEIVTDFTLVLTALEAGGPLPTDPPRDTVSTTPPRSEPETTTTAGDPSATDPTATPSADVSEPDAGFAPSDSPAERVNAYVEFVCRNSANNPGPPPTQPGSEPVVDDG